MTLAIVGTRGIPNNYGGFETLAEYLAEYLGHELNITVFCSSKDINTRTEEYNGVKLKYLNLTSHGAVGILYDSISLWQGLTRYDKVLFLGFGGGFVMPFLKKYRHKMILNIGGLDWKRSKWSTLAQKIIKKSESLLINNSIEIIADNKGIAEYLKKEYNRESTLIAYGGDQVNKISPALCDFEQYPFLKSFYAFIVTRIQPDNNIEMLIQAFAGHDQFPFVIVGNWKNSKYGLDIFNKYRNISNIILLDAIYDRGKLDILRSNCGLYVHGHSAGGTNPSLCEAMYLGLPVIAFASGYNEYTTDNKALYFHNVAELSQILENLNLLNLAEMGKKMETIAKEKYVWKNIANQYKEIILN
jgi:glycosyltransferase involved in cell wall biosynthesis